MERKKRPQQERDAGARIVSRAGAQSLTSYRVGALPLLNWIIARTGLEEHLRGFLYEDKRCKISNTGGLLIAVKNFLMAREPLYGIAQWAQQHAPDLLGITPALVPALNDDRIGRCLDRLFDAAGPSLVLAVMTRVVKEFGVSLDELHNDSTTVTLFGEYKGAAEQGQVRGKTTPAITWGNNKDHRPDLKQLLYTLTVSADGAVPVNYDVGNGNLTDDQTHRETWDLLCRLTGTVDFLYIADSKLATKENMAYIAGRGGRFISVLPHTRSEHKSFRDLLRRQEVDWVEIHQRTNEQGQVTDRVSVPAQGFTTAEGYRLLWFHSTRKQELDQMARATRIQRTLLSLGELRKKLASPRTRYREKSKVLKEVNKRLKSYETDLLIVVHVHEVPEEKYRQAAPGRPGKDTKYVRQVKDRFDITWEIDLNRMAEEAMDDGVFPLVTNDKILTVKEVLLAYKRQALIEKRFSQLKTDFQLAPVYLKEVSRIQALLCIYFLALVVQALLEREVRLAMKRENIESLPLYPEGRPCRAPTTRQIIDVFDNVLRHELTAPDGSTISFLPDLTPLQKEILRLLAVPLSDYRG